DARLRAMADVESRALASTYRVSEASINRALTTGETADTVREFLASISLTGIPQPLEYLIVGAAARFGSLRVGRITQSSIIANQPGAKSYVSAEDATQLSAILVDHGLTALGFTRVGPYRAVSRFDFEVVFWSLSEARYPVAAEDENGRIVLLERRRVARPVSAPQESPALVIVRRLRAVTETTPAETGQAWLERQIDTAIRAKIGLTVTVAMPDGSSVDLQLEPASLAGGRLRARDRRSDLERTLPLSSITAVGPALE
ncbi:MAG TPA: helicase-associated domain-containing protein, partial [Galbitalea sp.]